MVIVIVFNMMMVTMANRWAGKSSNLIEQKVKLRSAKQIILNLKNFPLQSKGKVQCKWKFQKIQTKNNKIFTFESQ